MLFFEEALKIVQDKVKPAGTLKIHMVQALNRVLAQNVVSDIDMPPFHKAAMDGYACRKSDLNELMEIIEEIPAGIIPSKKIKKGYCSRIMTGAVVPEGADFILMKEHATVENGKIKSINPSENTNICYKGEDIKRGDVVLKMGNILRSQHIAVLASAGCVEPMVYQLPSVAIISTGNELVEPSQKPGVPKIRNSNSYQLMAQAANIGLSPEYLGMAGDNIPSLERTLTGAIAKHNVTLISGGVSVGDYDFVPETLNKIGVQIKFHGLKVKPGKYLLFGEKNGHYIFGLPGNPVSSFVQFEVLVKPFLLKLMGCTCKNIIFQLPVAEKYTRKKTDVLNLVPVTINKNGEAAPIEYHGSAHIHAYSLAYGIMEVPIGISEYKKGEFVRVRPL